MNNLLNTVIQGNCISNLKCISDNSIDLIFADPPYNLQLQNELFRPNQTKVKGVNDKWDKFNDLKDYDKFCKSWLNECKRVLKPNGTMWIIGTYHNIFRIGSIIQDLGFWILNDILWIKTNPMPNFRGTRFNNAHETLLWIAKDKNSKFTFHYKAMKAYNEDKQMRSDWYIPICSGKERIKINGEKAHSTQKPEELLKRIILSSSNLGDIVLDPFLGSGTTAVVAKKYRRNFIAFEKEQFYIDIAKERLNKVKQLQGNLLEYFVENKPKVPFGNLLAKGFLKEGQNLYSKDEKIKATILADSTLKYKDEVGSIHRLSAKILNKSNNNGWEFWYSKNKDSLISINEMRENYVKKFIKI